MNNSMKSTTNSTRNTRLQVLSPPGGTLKDTPVLDPTRYGPASGPLRPRCSLPSYRSAPVGVVCGHLLILIQYFNTG